MGFAALAISVPAILYLSQAQNKAQAFIYRDDIGAFNGVKGYEEMVSEVGSHHGHNHWSQF